MLVRCVGEDLLADQHRSNDDHRRTRDPAHPLCRGRAGAEHAAGADPDTGVDPTVITANIAGEPASSAATPAATTRVASR